MPPSLKIRDALAGRIRREMGKGPRAVATIIDIPAASHVTHEENAPALNQAVIEFIQRSTARLDRHRA
jgi:pimeloyl-ACP methyl ester carboxylesterase